MLVQGSFVVRVSGFAGIYIRFSRLLGVGISRVEVLTLQHTNEWSVSQSALWYVLVMRKVCKSLHLVRIRSSWCQCFNCGCLQDTL